MIQAQLDAYRMNVEAELLAGLLADTAHAAENSSSLSSSATAGVGVSEKAIQRLQNNVSIAMVIESECDNVCFLCEYSSRWHVRTHIESRSTWLPSSPSGTALFTSHLP